MEDSEWLQGRLLKNEDTVMATTHHWPMAEERPGAFVFLVAGTVVAIVLSVICLRESYRRKYRIDLCPRFLTDRRTTSENLARDRIIAEELQHRLNQEASEAETKAIRRERQAWYENYIKDYTMTVTAKDFFHAHDTNEPDVELGVCDHASPSSEVGNDPPARKSSATLSISNDKAEEIDNHHGGLEADENLASMECKSGEEKSQLSLRLPVKDKDIMCRIVDACCGICFCDYVEGDKVVWSGLECRHAFHDTCILPWLSNGKKRCPICRYWFVPGARIEDQKKELERRLRMEADTTESSNMSDETGDETGDSTSFSDQELRSEISNGDLDGPSTAQEASSPGWLGLDLEFGVETVSDVSSHVETEKDVSSYVETDRATNDNTSRY